MTNIHIYGIANCDTVKKARRWLDQQHIAYQFHDFKKEPPSLEQLTDWLAALGRDVLINKRGTSWRNLDDASKLELDDRKALTLLQANSSLIKRPLLDTGRALHVGFSEADYQHWLLSGSDS